MTVGTAKEENVIVRLVFRLQLEVSAKYERL